MLRRSDAMEQRVSDGVAVKIVEFDPVYAAGVAKMWNESRDSWGGDDAIMTADQVIEKEGNSTSLHLYLAIVEGEVAGYCSLAEYKEDTGALYIPLLNVHPSYHGLKIGKKLVLHALNRTVELGWPRLDLFTWAGNTKAVPLYKKCGFFWEDRDDAVHLMNFMPTILQLDCVKPFFSKYDWYETSQRVIEVKPDGEKQNGFTFYEYTFSVQNEFVTARFERSSRRLCYLETNDFKIEVSRESFKVLAYKEVSVTYRVENYTEAPLDIRIEGDQTGAIDHSVRIASQVEKTAKYAVPLVVAYDEQEPNDWRTHPFTDVVVSINGASIPLGLGVYPILPVTIELVSDTLMCHAGEEKNLYVQIENALDISGELSFAVPSTEVLETVEETITCKLGPKEKVLIPVRGFLCKGGAYDERVLCTFHSDGEVISFTSRIRCAFPTKQASFSLESADKWTVYNGSYYASLQKRDNTLLIGRSTVSDSPYTFYSSKLGKPYADEFSKKAAEVVKVRETGDSIILAFELTSTKHVGVSVVTTVFVRSNGAHSLTFELKADGTHKEHRVSWVQSYVPKLVDAFIPMGRKVLRLTESHAAFNDYLDDRHYTEPWIFQLLKGVSTGLSWSTSLSHRKDDWKNALEVVDVVLEESSAQSILLGELSLSMDNHASWREWRKEVIGTSESLEEVGPLLIANGVGAIVPCDATPTAALLSHLNVPLTGTLTVNEKIVEVTEQEREVLIEVEKSTGSVQVVETSFVSANTKLDENVLFLHPTRDLVVVEEVEAGHYRVKNGELEFSSHSMYMGGVYSILYKGEEWLHHSFPQPSMRAWWNPWTGGLSYRLGKMSNFSLQKEGSTICRTEKCDSDGNEWVGIEVTTKMEHHEKYKGVELKQYFLTLPGVPVIVSFAMWTASANSIHLNVPLWYDGFWNPCNDLGAITYQSKPKGQVEYYGGGGELELFGDPFARLQSRHVNESLYIVPPEFVQEQEAYITKEVCYINTEDTVTLRPGIPYSTRPTIHLLDTRDLREEIEQLRSISFSERSNVRTDG